MNWGLNKIKVPPNRGINFYSFINILILSNRWKSPKKACSQTCTFDWKKIQMANNCKNKLFATRSLIVMNTLDEQVWSYIGVFSICATFINCLYHISIEKHNDSAKQWGQFQLSNNESKLGFYRYMSYRYAESF